ncbi:thiol oxidoreductase [Roseateles chitinivorans]|uniref:Thiol oxidoreductase n=1 Tax=Roseateles chitinivorans TaxID=2917965 RepID=A0A2G9C4Z1_9BURK|nr:di-heme oxidoredictase family protein [Roseateles chitinivorans]PIM51510.1 thiol oxidoreductase [Roseateles chitinivorans]
MEFTRLGIAIGRAFVPALLGSALLAACGGGNGEQDPGARSAAQDSGGTADAAARAKAQASGDSSETALTPVAATASSMERGDLGGAKAIDHDEASRWGSAFTDNEWLTLDYGSSVAISRVTIKWENAHATRYQLQTSEDNQTWTTIKTVENSGGGIENLTGLAGQGRYLRMQGLSRSTQYGYSIFEIQAFTGTPVPPTLPADPTDPTDPTTPTTPTEPLPGDVTQPGVEIKPVAVIASSVENGGLAAANTVDGNLQSRWASKPEDGTWIQYDFGAPQPLGYLKLVWENAYGKAYAIQVSDDGKAWTELRNQPAGKGGTEEYYNLGVKTRYLRLQGIARATAYGYSLFEVQFKSIGSDNSIPSARTSALPVPASGANLAALFQPQAPIETLQITLPDGTLVTRFGQRGVGRHGRERGEDWNEIGFGPNETVDAMGNPVDKGPGAYMNFVPNYFRNRTWGVEFIDNSRVAGVTKPRLIVNQYFPQAQRGGGHSFFRRIDDPKVTGYGWMSPGQLLDSTTYTDGFKDLTSCPIVPKPPQNGLRRPDSGYAGVIGANDGCSVVLDNMPGHSDLAPNANGVLVPNGVNIPARSLKLGEAIEFTGSFFSSRAAMDAIGDKGDFRYYTTEVVYVMGSGLQPWYGVQPRLNSVPLPESTWSGGLGSVSYNYSDEGFRMFQQPFNNIGMQNLQRFVEGRRLVHSSFVTGAHSEPGNDPMTAIQNLAGQRFSATACIQCHTNNGRSPAPFAAGQRMDRMSFHVGTQGADGAIRPDPRYGLAIQMNAVSSTGAPQDWGNGVKVAGFETRSVTLADGTKVELRKPRFGFDGPVPQLWSARAAQPMIGVGLLEAVPEADILSRVRAQADADGVLGKANFVFDPESGATRLGRFGWKASKASLRHQVASALLNDMSVTSPVYPNRSCATDPVGCRAAPAQKGIEEGDLVSLTQYMQLIAVPAQRSLPSGFPKGVAPLDEHRVDPVLVQAGRKVFDALRCAACHTAEMKTGKTHPFAELRDQTIRPFTDLLLHDMGPALADNLPEGQATGALWRTSPLWGIGYTEKVQGSTPVGYLHDGRARTLTEAILWHGGEAEKSRQRFEQLSKADRDALLAWLRTL